MKRTETSTLKNSAEPILDQHGPEIQRFGSSIPMPIGLDENVCLENVKLLNQILADTMTLRDLYKKSHWQTAGPTFYQLHLLFDKHFQEQVNLVDLLAERVQILGGISIAMAPDVAETTKISRPPRGREEAPVQISRLLEAHQVIIGEVREAIKQTEENEDFGSNDLLMSDVLRTNEMQVWFLAEHLVDIPLLSTSSGERAA